MASAGEGEDELETTSSSGIEINGTGSVVTLSFAEEGASKRVLTTASPAAAVVGSCGCLSSISLLRSDCILLLGRSDPSAVSK